MAHEGFIEQLLALPDTTAQQRFLAEHAVFLDDQVADALKGQADRFLRSDVQHSLQTAALLCALPELTGNPCHRALGLLAEANARSVGGLGEYERAVHLYDEAAEIYRACGKVVEPAKSQVGKVWSLSCLGRHDEAFETGAWASRVLEENGQWRILAGLMVNLGIVHSRQGDDTKSLALWEQAGELYRELGPEGKPFLALNQLNRAIAQRNLGQFEASIQTSKAAYSVFTELGQRIEAARTQQNLALTYFVLGQYNEALKLLDEARDVFCSDGRERDAILVDLYASDCLLQLRRFTDVVDKCQEVRSLFFRLGTRLEVAQAILNEATAYAGLGRYQEAEASLSEARDTFAAEGNDVWVAFTDLERAVVMHARNRHDESLILAQACAEVLRLHDLPIEEAQSFLIAAKALVAMKRYDEARELARHAQACGENNKVSVLTYQSRHLMGMIAAAEGETEEALAEYDQAIRELEHLRGSMMVEFRAGFLEDKQTFYDDAINLCLELKLPERGLEYAERAKSRALLDLIACRLDLEIQPRVDGDRPLIEQLMRLRQERDRLYRRQHTESGFETRGSMSPADDAHAVQRDVLSLEKQITDLWHRLLIRHADYARDADLWQVQTSPVKPYLAQDTLLVEYFVAGQNVIAFLVTQKTVQARRLSVELAQVQHLAELLRLNFQACSSGDPELAISLIANARWLLQQLHESLIAPLAEDLTAYAKLILIPHGSLHYLPFHAFYDGASFLLEKYVISYLPAASLLAYCCKERTAVSQRAVFGHSHGGHLPCALEESRSIAALLHARAYAEDGATVAGFREVAPNCQILHLAAHGDFRPDNPLFSGLALADGWLTTLDIFNLHLNASLVTLSACQTGQSVVGGGDELIGLMRAFLYAGAASLVLSLWAVDDRSTGDLMTGFYQALVGGETKDAALRQAQVRFLGGQTHNGYLASKAYTHPYFWAPFFLVGHAGALSGIGAPPLAH
jgi:CHAT domain-containing protein